LFARMIRPLVNLSVTLALATGGSACGWLEPPVERGQVLFQDNFSRPTSGWDRYQDDIYVSDYSEGSYRIAVFTPNTEVWARPHLELSDVRIDVIASKVDGPDDNVFGVICRYQNTDNFYFFLISSDGYSGIGAYKDGVETLLSSDTMLPAQSIRQGPATNFIRAECVGQQLALYINSVLVAQTQDDEWPSGDVGLIAGTYAHPNVDIRFTNFSVLKP
jgi:hypothetical protein